PSRGATTTCPSRRSTWSARSRARSSAHGSSAARSSRARRGPRSRPRTRRARPSRSWPRPPLNPVAADGRHTFDLSIVTPDGAAYEGEAEMVIVPGADGEIGVLARHAPLVALLKAGSTRVHVRRDGEVLEFATGPGFFKVERDRAIAL